MAKRSTKSNLSSRPSQSDTQLATLSRRTMKSKPLSKPPHLEPNSAITKSQSTGQNNPNDFTRTPLGGLPQPTFEWYEQYSDLHGKSLPPSRCRISDLYRGFKMTISLYISVDNRISELLKNGTTYDESAIFDTINREFTFLRDPELPKWWARDAMSVWIRMTACWREQEQRERKSGLLVDVKELGKDAAKRFKSDLLVPVKHGFFIVSVGNGKELRKIIVPVGDFLAEGEGVVAGTRFKDLKILALWRLLRQREGSVVDQKRDKLVVKKTLENGSVVDIHLSSNFDLHNGVVWKAFDGSAINLEIIKPEERSSSGRQTETVME